MKIKKVGALCKTSGRYYLFDQKDEDGEFVRQWLGDAGAVYPLDGLPYMTVENVCAMYDLTAEKREKVFLHHETAPEMMNWNDADDGEQKLRDPELCLRYQGKELLPLRTSTGIAFIQEKYLSPLPDFQYLQLYERRTEQGGLYIVAKIGFVVQAIIVPIDVIKDDLLETLDDLDRLCHEAARRRTEQISDPENENVDQKSIFHVDGSTGENSDLQGTVKGGGGA